MAVNKVEYSGKTLMDLTSDTVSADTLLKGVVAHDASGEQIVGTFDADKFLEKSGGDAKDVIVSFTSNDTESEVNSWSDVSKLSSKEKFNAMLAKISTMFKNIRYLYKIIGSTNITAIGDGTLTGGLNEVNSKLGMQMYSIMDDSYLNKSLMDIILEMPNESEYFMPYIKCAEKNAIINLGFSQYSTMRITKLDGWNIYLMIVGMHGSPIGFWLGNRNSADIVSEISVYKS